jgi:membrane protein implicated in regulation of membrane protease activity
MNESTIWWLIAGSLVGIELMTGTFYLLMLAIGASAGAIAAHAQLSFSSQLITGSVVGGLAVILWRVYSLQKLKSHPEEVSAQHLDVGETVEVQWHRASKAQRCQLDRYLCRGNSARTWRLSNPRYSGQHFGAA